MNGEEFGRSAKALLSHSPGKEHKTALARSRHELKLDRKVDGKRRLGILPTLPLLAQEAVRTGTYVLMSEEPAVGVTSNENKEPKSQGFSTRLHCCVTYFEGCQFYSRHECIRDGKLNFVVYYEV